MDKQIKNPKLLSVGIILILLGVWTLFSAILKKVGTNPDESLRSVVVSLVSYINMILGIIHIVFGYFIIKNKNWAVISGIILTSIYIILYLFSLLINPFIIILLILYIANLVLLIQGKKKLNSTASK